LSDICYDFVYMSKKLPVFPDFEKLSLAHKDVLQAMANNFPSSDFNFAGLFTWDVGGIVTVSSLNGNLVICASDYLTHDKFYSFIGSNKVDETIKTIIDYAEEHGEDTTLKLIPESVAAHIKQTGIHQVNEDRDNHDYIYSVGDLAELKGGKYRKKRSILYGFTREHGSRVRQKELDLEDKNIREDIQKVMSKWQQSRKKSGGEVRDEFTAIQKALEHHQVLGLRAYGVYDNADLIAFLIFEILPGKVAIGHFEKADTRYKGIFEHLKHNLARHLDSLDIKTFNTEQDLGIKGLRKSKESLHPTTYIKKCTIKRIK